MSSRGLTSSENAIYTVAARFPVLELFVLKEPLASLIWTVVKAKGSVMG